MSLRNLSDSRLLHPHTPDKDATVQLLAHATRCLEDARIEQLSAESRFATAYRCIQQCATLGLWAHGYRGSTNQPGHHQLLIQTLGLTLGIAQGELVIFDALRRQHHLSDYEGDPVAEQVLVLCIEHAAMLLECTARWLRLQDRI